jgi:hypothetical protein
MVAMLVSDSRVKLPVVVVATRVKRGPCALGGRVGFLGSKASHLLATGMIVLEAACYALWICTEMTPTCEVAGKVHLSRAALLPDTKRKFKSQHQARRQARGRPNTYSQMANENPADPNLHHKFPTVGAKKL